MWRSIRTAMAHVWRSLHTMARRYVGRNVEPRLGCHLGQGRQRGGRVIPAMTAMVVLRFRTMVDHSINTCLRVLLRRWLGVGISRWARRRWACSRRDRCLHIIAALDGSRLSRRRHSCLWTFVRRRCLSLRLLFLSARLGLGFLRIPHRDTMSLLDVPDLSYSIVAIASVQTRDKLGYQVGMLRGLLHGGQARARRLPLPRARRHISIMPVAINPYLQISLDLFLQQLQVQLAQRLGRKAIRIVQRIFRNQRHLLQVLGYFVEVGTINAIVSQSLEHEQALERCECVVVDGHHEAGVQVRGRSLCRACGRRRSRSRQRLLL